MKFFKYLVVLFCFCLLNIKAAEKNAPLSVVIVGGGPSGLATAIEAKMKGCDVTIVEKRDSYSRPQWIFLSESSLKLLEKWQVETPEMKTPTLNGNLMGVVRIKYLEKQLAMKASEIGVKKIYGEFQDFLPNQRAIISSPEKNTLILSYDILVGADGAHSKVRESLSIGQNCMGKAMGATALILDHADDSAEMEISSSIKRGNVFLRRIKAPHVSIIFMQSPQSASKNDIQKELEMQKWSKENRAFILADIPISLSQAHIFSDEKKSAILVGDAAATASFFQGIGANTAFLTAEIAGRFFEELRFSNPDALQSYNESVRQVTDAMIKDSAYLFCENFSSTTAQKT